MLKLRIISGDQNGTTCRLMDGSLSIGRSQQADFTLTDQSASRLHASIQTEGDQASISDLGSSNGTLVNGERIEHTTQLLSGDVVTLAKTHLVFSDGSHQGLRLLCTYGTAIGRQFEVTDGRLVIGRDGDCEISLNDRSLSIMHAAIDCENGVLHVHDLNSKSGTYLDSERVTTSTRMRSGATLALGRHRFVVIDPAIDDLDDSFFEGYTLVSRRPGGGLGAEFDARAHLHNEMVTLTVYPPAVIADTSVKARLLNAARKAQRLSHDHIVPTLDCATHEGYLTIASATIQGATFEDMIEGAQQPNTGVIAKIMLQTAEAFSHAADHGIIHGSLSLKDIIIDQDNQALVNGFGLNAVLDRALPSSAEYPYYRSPEELDGENADVLSDQYALGAVAYHALTKQIPFDAPDPASVARAHRHQQLAHIADYNPEVPAPLAKIVGKMLAIERDDRYSDWDAVIDDLSTFIERGSSASVAASRVASPSMGAPSGKRRRPQRRSSRRQSTALAAVRRETKDIPANVRMFLALALILIAMLFGWILIRPYVLN